MLAIALMVHAFCVAFSQIATDSIWNDEIKSVFLTRSDIEMERPIIRMGAPGDDTEQLMLRFDIDHLTGKEAIELTRKH